MCPVPSLGWLAKKGGYFQGRDPGLSLPGHKSPKSAIKSDFPTLSPPGIKWSRAGSAVGRLVGWFLGKMYFKVTVLCFQKLISVEGGGIFFFTVMM